MGDVGDDMRAWREHKSKVREKNRANAPAAIKRVELAGFERVGKNRPKGYGTDALIKVLNDKVML